MTGWWTATDTSCVVSLPAASTATSGSRAGGAGSVRVKRPAETGTLWSSAVTRTASDTEPVIVTEERSDAAVAGACTCKVGGVVSTEKSREVLAPAVCTVSLCFPAVRPAAVTGSTPSPADTWTARPSTAALALRTDVACTCTTRSAARLAPMTALAGRSVTVSELWPPPHPASGASSPAARTAESIRGTTRNTTTFTRDQQENRRTAPRLGRRGRVRFAGDEHGGSRHQPAAQRAPLRPRLVVPLRPLGLDKIIEEESGGDDLSHP